MGVSCWTIGFKVSVGDVVGKPSDLAVGVLDGMGQNGVLGGVELDGHDVILICRGVVMNALFGSEAKQCFLGLRNKSVLRDFRLRGLWHGCTQLDTRLERGFQCIAHAPDCDIVEVKAV